MGPLTSAAAVASVRLKSRTHDLLMPGSDQTASKKPGLNMDEDCGVEKRGERRRSLQYGTGRRTSLQWDQVWSNEEDKVSEKQRKTSVPCEQPWLDESKDIKNTDIRNTVMATNGNQKVYKST